MNDPNSISPPAIVSPDATTLETLKFELEAALASAPSRLVEGIEAYRQIGVLLIRAKGECKHGEWLPWLEKHFPKLKKRAYQRYMALAIRFPNAHDGALLTDGWAILSGRRDKTIGKDGITSYENVRCRECRIKKEPTANCRACKEAQDARRAKDNPEPGASADKESDAFAAENEKLLKAMTRNGDGLAKTAVQVLKTRELTGEANGNVRKFLELIPTVVEAVKSPIREPFRKPCQDCGQEILFAVDVKGKWQALNLVQSAGGKYLLMGRVARWHRAEVFSEQMGHTHHYTTCPKGGKRKRGRA